MPHFAFVRLYPKVTKPFDLLSSAIATRKNEPLTPSLAAQFVADGQDEINGDTADEKQKI